MYILYQEANENHKPGFHQSLIAFSEYPSYRKICIMTTITHYLEITKDVRITDQLATGNHIRQPQQARLTGGAKSYFGEKELILRSIRHIQQDKPL